MRILQLLLLGMVWAFTGSVLQGRILAGSYGQLATLLLFLQVLRLLGNSLVRRWIVWSILALVQLLLLACVLAGGGPPAEPGQLGLQVGWIAGLSTVLAASGLAMAFTFAVSWLLRRSASSSSDFYEELPPMAASQEWISRAVTLSLLPVLVSPVALLLDRSRWGGSLMPAVPQLLIAALIIYAAARFRRRVDTRQLLLPNALVLLSFLISAASLCFLSPILRLLS